MSLFAAALTTAPSPKSENERWRAAARAYCYGVCGVAAKRRCLLGYVGTGEAKSLLSNIAAWSGLERDLF